MAADLETINVIARKDYKKDRLSTVVVICFMQVGLLCAFGGFIFHQILSTPKPIVFQATKNKQVIVPSSLDVSAMNAAAVLNWSIEAITIAYSFNYHSIQNHFAKISPYFDQRGLEKFVAIVANDTNMQQVKPDKLIVSIQAREAPKIIKEGKVEGRYAWRIQLPMAVRYENATVVRRQDIDVELYIWRVPEVEAPIGIKITNLSVAIKQGYDQLGQEHLKTQ